MMTKKDKIIGIIAGIFVLAIIVVYGWAATATATYYTSQSGTSPARRRDGADVCRRMFRKVIVADSDGDANDFKVTLTSLYGYLERIVIDSNGEDKSYKVYFKDENAIAIFSKTDCNSLEEPYSYIISETDDSNNVFPGVPVAGDCTIEMVDGNDASMDDIKVSIYFAEYWQM